MVVRLDVKLQVDDLKRQHIEAQRTVRKIAARAINRAIDAAKTQAKRSVSAATKIKVNDVAKRMSVRGATPDRLIAELEAHPYSPNLAAFNARKGKQGASATAWEGRKTYKGSFILPSGKVVTRTTSKRTPLKGLRGPSVKQTFKKPAVLEAVEKAASARFDAEFERETTRRLG